ncbi:hypothetical protein Tco_1115353 [Tanacetum coccineum]
MSSDSASSEVTYMSILSHGDPLAWAVDLFRLQEPDSPEAAPTSPDYMPGPEEPEQALLSPDYVSGPEYPEYLAPSDEEVPVEDQPYAVADSPIALSPGYVADSDPEEDPEEDSEDGLVNYPADGGDGDDDDSSNDDEEEEEASKLYEVGESLTAAPRPAGGHGIDYGFIGTLDAETRRQRAKTVGYRIRDTWVDPRESAKEIAPVTLEGVNTRVTELAAVQEQDTQDIYVVIEDVQDRQSRIFQSVEALIDDRQYHYKTARLLDQEALDPRLDAGSPYRCAGFIDSGPDRTCFITVGILPTALGEIRALQARDQARADAPEGTCSSA